MRDSWEPKPGDKVVRHPRQAELNPVRVTVTTRKVPSKALASPLILIYAFAGLIILGTLLLLLPFTHHGDGFTPFMTALFTSTSAVTLTGLIIQDTATYWTRIGQALILCLMFIGGLGFMTIATFLLVLIGQRVTLAQRILVKESLGVNQLGGLVRLTVGIVTVASAIQLCGFVLLLARFWFLFEPEEAIWQAIFHAVSGFNNAGFVALTGANGLADFKDDKVVLGVLAILIILGSLGYAVMIDIVRYRKFSLFTLNTKLVLVFTTTLLLVGMGSFLVSEYQNPQTLGLMSLDQKIMTSMFESISGRTSGFSTINFGATEQQTNFLFSSLMFIGGASGSVAGGIKINTFAVVLVAIMSTLKGRRHASAFGREIPQSQVQRAMVIGSVSTAFVFLIALLLNFSEKEFQFIDLFFEGVSAAGTVGLSTGLTPLISSWGHLILITAMFVGRIGPVTLGLAMAQRLEMDTYRYAQERVTIG